MRRSTSSVSERWRRFCEADVVAFAPESSGVYVLAGQSTPIYVGEAANLKERLIEHLWPADALDTAIFARKPSFFRFERLPAGIRVLRQKELVRDLQPLHRPAARVRRPPQTAPPRRASSRGTH